MTDATRKKITKWFWICIIVPVLMVIGLLALVWVFADIPSFEELENPDSKLATQVIAEDGEILVKGPSVFSSYYHNEEATRQVLDPDGFLHTGDIGELSKDGFLKITDRKKEMFKTSGGKFVAPQVLENKLMESVLIAQVMVVGEGRRFPSALIVPAFEELKAWCASKNIAWTSNEEMIRNEAVIEKYGREVERLNDGFGHWEQVKKFILLPREWTIDASELTPKLSLKRKVILQNHQAQIEKLYAEVS